MAKVCQVCVEKSFLDVCVHYGSRTLVEHFHVCRCSRFVLCLISATILTNFEHKKKYGNKKLRHRITIRVKKNGDKRLRHCYYP